jgi:hypothetical protein
MLNSPLVILLDIDGTLIGDITPQVCLYEIKKRCNKVPMNVKHLHSNLQEGIIRPHFKKFFHDLRAHGVEFFIYTSSEKKWAEYIVKQIESVTDTKFNRPLFTRNNCKLINGDYKKSIASVTPAIIKTLKKKYNNITPASLKNMIMAIDNNNVYERVDYQNLLLCPTYRYKIPENIPALISKDIFAAHNAPIMSVLSSYYPNIKHTNNYFRFQRQIYINYVSMLTDMLKERESANNDKLFSLVNSFIITKNISTFKANVVQYLNNKVKNDTTRSFF